MQTPYEYDVKTIVDPEWHGADVRMRFHRTEWGGVTYWVQESDQTGRPVVATAPLRDVPEETRVYWERKDETLEFIGHLIQHGYSYRSYSCRDVWGVERGNGSMWISDALPILRSVYEKQGRPLPGYILRMTEGEQSQINIQSLDRYFRFSVRAKVGPDMVVYDAPGWVDAPLVARRGAAEAPMYRLVGRTAAEWVQYYRGQGLEVVESEIMPVTAV